LTLGVLGGVALSEGIKFLYGQATELLKRRRKRKDAKKAAEPVCRDAHQGDHRRHPS
jgi:hypothetical protein